MSEITITPLGTISPYTKGNMNCPGVLINYNNKKILLGQHEKIFDKVKEKDAEAVEILSLLHIKNVLSKVND